ncbi:MAG: HlyD family efflux transporter periplasmic adaptor subunit [Deltaproteobacteria bacterium]|nr:HlyD family efflux transporter periplasmic adaptor subunit [Deltaproteobacteria bacterium]
MTKRKKLIFAILGGLMVMGVGLSLLSQWWSALPEGLLLASGRIEGDEIVIAPKIAGRAVAVLKDRGETVATGELLVRLSSEQIQAQLDRAREQERYWQDRVRQAEIDLDYTAQQVPKDIAAAEAQVATVEARIQEAEALLNRNHKDFLRYQALLARRVAPQQKLDDATANYQASEANKAALTRELAQTQAQWRKAQLLPQTVELKRAEVQAAQASLAAAQAVVREAEANLDDTLIHSPADGILLTRTVEPGEVVNPGTPLFTMVDLNQLYLKVFVNEPDIGKIRLGQEARIYVDAFPDRPFPARVSRVSPRAEFTPKYVETREERVKMVFAVELRAENQEGYLKPGMPGEGLLRWKDDVPWQRPR